MICLPTFITGFSDVIGSWKIIAICEPQYSRIALASRLAELLAVEENRALADRAPLGQQTHDRARQHRLAGARLADDAERPAPVEVERHAVDGAHDAPARLEVCLEVDDPQQRLVRPGARARGDRLIQLSRARRGGQSDARRRGS